LSVIFFKDSKKVPALPFSAIDSLYPNDLWDWMDAQRKAGIELLAISHNANLSDGIMFPVEEDYKGRPIDAAWAQQRMTNEPLTESTRSRVPLRPIPRCRRMTSSPTTQS
jgi:hypothetical protein